MPWRRKPSDELPTLSEPLVSVRDADLGYGRRPVLRGVRLEIREGEFLGIVGPNGAGKSTLLKTILGLLRPMRGEVACRGGRRSLRFGYVPQRETVDTVFPVTALELAMTGRHALEGPLSWPGRDGRKRAMESLDRVGMADRANILLRDLSGGQLQRVLIARALCLEPRVLVLDEPTNGMDLESEHALMELIAALHAQRALTVVMVSHLLNVVVNYVRSLALLGGPGVISGPISEVLTVENLERLYGTKVTLGELDGRRVVLPCRERHGAR